MKQNHAITFEQRALAILLTRELKLSFRQIALKTNMSKTSAQRIVKQADGGNRKILSKKCHPGRRKSFSERDQCKLKRAIIQLREKSPNFTVMEVVQRSGISTTLVTYRTFVRQSRQLHTHLNVYAFYLVSFYHVVEIHHFRPSPKSLCL